MDPKITFLNELYLQNLLPNLQRGVRFYDLEVFRYCLFIELADILYIIVDAIP